MFVRLFSRFLSLSLGGRTPPFSPKSRSACVSQVDNVPVSFLLSAGCSACSLFLSVRGWESLSTPSWSISFFVLFTPDAGYSFFFPQKKLLILDSRPVFLSPIHSSVCAKCALHLQSASGSKVLFRKRVHLPLYFLLLGCSF